MMFKRTALCLSAATFLILPQAAAAQMDEIVVTGVRIQADIEDLDTFGPGIFLEQKGDFLLLSVTMENDSRDLKDRLSELQKTADGMLKAAENKPDIELSIVDGDIVRPLSRSKFDKSIRGGRRPDTSMAFIRVKTKIPETVTDSYTLATKLSDFVGELKEVGRTKIMASGDVSVSIVNPYQYRPQLIEKVVNEIDAVTDALGPDYRAVVKGLDREITWVRSGDLNLAFTLPYSYDIVPTHITTYR